ncbi:MAG: hypothetical protein HYZ53_01210 [Planctomycetes bacterium]|nr:hypothetical protein [Planctomycetota bacterium]
MTLATLRYAEGCALRLRGKDATVEFSGAIAALDGAMAIQPNSAETAINQAALYRELGDEKRDRGQDPADEYRRAMAGCNRALEINPKNAAAANNQANVFASLGDRKLARGVDPTDEYRKALAGFDRALAINPTYAAAAANQALVYRSLSDQKLGRGEDPTDEFRKSLQGHALATRLDPALWQAHANRGLLLEILGQPSEAIRAYEAALAIAGDAAASFRPRLARARATVAGHPWAAPPAHADNFVDLGHYATARPLYEQALAAWDADLRQLPEADRIARLTDPSTCAMLGNAHYNLACLLALASTGRVGPTAQVAPAPVDAAEAARLHDAAFEHVRAALALGYADAGQLAADADLAPLHDDPRRQGILDALPKRSRR